MDSDSQIQSLAQIYSKCVAARINDAWNSDKPQTIEKEFCLKEKNDYYSYMKSHFRVEYDNVMKTYERAHD